MPSAGSFQANCSPWLSWERLCHEDDLIFHDKIIQGSLHITGARILNQESYGIIDTGYVDIYIGTIPERILRKTVVIRKNMCLRAVILT
jgi:hypothetical protein